MRTGRMLTRSVVGALVVMASVRFAWPSGAVAGAADVAAVVRRFCRDHPENPGCRG